MSSDEADPHARAEPRRSPLLAVVTGAPVGLLGGLIGLGGAEFRLPLLKALFRYPIHRAVALNLAVSLITLVASLAIRLRTTQIEPLRPMVPVMLGMIAGSMTGAFFGATWASRLSVRRLEQTVLLLLVAIGLALMVEAFIPFRGSGIPGSLAVRLPVAVVLGLGIGIVSSLLGVAGGEIIIPTLVFVFGLDIKLAGTASVMISLPTVAVGCLRYSRKRAYADRRDLPSLVIPMGLGSIAGALGGGLLLQYVPSGALKLGLGVILIISAVKIFRHSRVVPPAPLEGEATGGDQTGSRVNP